MSAPTVDLVPYQTDGCAVTIANSATPPGERFSPGHHGNRDIWTTLWPQGTVIFEPGGPGERREDGSLEMKWPWWRGAQGRLEIMGRRLDGAAAPLSALIPNGYGDTGFQVSGLRFPTPGCWQVTAGLATRS